MTEDSDNILADEQFADRNVPAAYRAVQDALDDFVSINYDMTYRALASYCKINDLDYLRQQIIPILGSNPPLATVPKYLRDGRENYLWYSDFYDDAGKNVFQQYRQFVAPAAKITPVNYATELEKIDLSYFKELVDLVSLEKLYQEAERKRAAAGKKPAPDDVIEQATEETAAETPTKQPKPKRSYEPKLNNEQYALLAECIEKIRLFRRPITAAGLKKLLTGRLADPLQVMKQLSLVYLLDEMRTCGFIKMAWMTVAFENKDFISFRTPGVERRYGSEPHYLTMEQFKSRRTDKKSNFIHGWEEIDEAIAKMRECGDK